MIKTTPFEMVFIIRDAMYKQCKSSQSAQRQAHIANCLRELIQAKPYQEISITELCKYADTPRNTFYRYFGSKEAVLKYLLDQSLYELLEKLMTIYKASHERELVNYIAYWLRSYRENDALWDLFHKDDRHNIMLGQMVKYYAKLADPIYKLDFNNQQTKQMIFLAYGMQGLLDVWKYTGYAQSAEEVALQIYKLMQTPMMESLSNEKRAEEVLSEIKTQTYYVD